MYAMKEFTLTPCAAHMSIVVLLWVVSIGTSQQIPDSQSLVIDELEHLLVDNRGKNDGAFFSGITPCSTYFDGSTGRFDNTLGRQTSSQWIRTAFRKLFLSAFSFWSSLSYISLFLPTDWQGRQISRHLLGGPRFSSYQGAILQTSRSISYKSLRL